MKLYSINDWYTLAKDLYDLICKEIDITSDSDLPIMYPRFIVMYEFFRLVRGGAFHDVRPCGLKDLQKEIYKMEDSILAKIKQVAQKLDPNDDRTISYAEDMKKYFNSDHFRSNKNT